MVQLLLPLWPHCFDVILNYFALVNVSIPKYENITADKITIICLSIIREMHVNKQKVPSISFYFGLHLFQMFN